MLFRDAFSLGDVGRNRALGTPFEVQTVTSSVTTESHVDMYAVQAALGQPITVTLDPGAFHGDQVVVQDVGDNASVQPIVVQASTGQTIVNGFGASLSIQSSGGSVQLTFDEPLGGWIPQLGTTSSSTPTFTLVATTPGGGPTTTVDTGYKPPSGHAAEFSGSFNAVDRTAGVTTGGIIEAAVRNFGGTTVVAGQTGGGIGDLALNTASVLWGVSAAGTITMTFQPPSAPVYPNPIDWIARLEVLQN
jgi:hypothetical protein